MIIHIPHSSRVIPADLNGLFVIGKDELELELLRMTDAYTEELYDYPEAVRVVFPISRLVVDPERFADDGEEPMSAMGMGVIYEKTSSGYPLKRKITGNERASLLRRFYYPHHRALQTAVKKELLRNRKVLIVDCHSFPSEPLPCDLDQMYPRPDFCIGTDAFHTPPELLDAVLAVIRGEGYSVVVDRPYSGTIVPMLECRINGAVHSIMLEVRRGLYVDETNGKKTRVFLGLKIL